jgi:hypothetical protein
VQSLDGTKSLVPVKSPLALSATPGIEELVKWSFPNVDQATLTFGTNALDAYAIVSLCRAYYQNTYPMRGSIS